MSSPQISRLESDIRELTLKQSNLVDTLGQLGGAVGNISAAVQVLQGSSTATPTSPVANQLWNGELGHSVNSWYDAAYVTTDKAKECAHFFSHRGPFSARSFTTIATNNELPIAGHGCPDGTAVQLTTDDTLPSGGGSPPALLTTYYTYAPSVDILKLATTEALALAGAPDVTFTAGTGLGNHRVEQILSLIDARISSTNRTLKAPSHSTYDPLFNDWDSVRGESRIYGNKSLDTPMPANFIDATVGNVFTSFVLARRNSYISIPESARLGVGVWDNTSGQRDWLTGSLDFNAVATIDGATTIERRYRMYVVTDRGYAMLSPEIVVANAPDDGEYDTDNFVSLSWRAVPGYLFIQLMVYTPSTGVYRLMEETSSGAFTFTDNGSFLRTIVGYPTENLSERKAVFYSQDGELDDINPDGTPWRTFFAPVPIPDNYDKGATTDRQWLRIFQTEPCDLIVPQITTDGSATIVASADAFDDEYDSEYEGLQIIVYDQDGVQLVDTTIDTRTDQTTMVLDATVAAGVNRIIRIVGGGFHGILIDKVHAGYQRNVSFAPNPLDVRALQPVAAPSGSSQGGPGTGPGSGGGGGIICVTDDTPVQLASHESTYRSIEAARLIRGYNVEGENLKPNIVRDVDRGMARVRLVRTKNGFYKRCSNSHRFRMTKWDGTGTSLMHLSVGDLVYTNIDGRDELSPIVEIGPLSKDYVPVVTPRLSGGHYYRAGSWQPKWWQRILIALGLMKSKTGGIYAHNRKDDDGYDIIF